VFFLQLETECRQEICKRMLKYCRQQQTGKKKKGEEDMLVTVASVIK